MTASNGNFDWRSIQDSAVEFGDDGDHTIRKTTNPAHLKALDYARRLYERSVRGELHDIPHPARDRSTTYFGDLPPSEEKTS